MSLLSLYSMRSSVLDRHWQIIGKVSGLTTAALIYGGFLINTAKHTSVLDLSNLTSAPPSRLNPKKDYVLVEYMTAEKGQFAFVCDTEIINVKGVKLRITKGKEFDPKTLIFSEFVSSHQLGALNSFISCASFAAMLEGRCSIVADGGSYGPITTFHYCNQGVKANPYEFIYAFINNGNLLLIDFDGRPVSYCLGTYIKNTEDLSFIKRSGAPPEPDSVIYNLTSEFMNASQIYARNTENLLMENVPSEFIGQPSTVLGLTYDRDQRSFSAMPGKNPAPRLVGFVNNKSPVVVDPLWQMIIRGNVNVIGPTPQLLVYQVDKRYYTLDPTTGLVFALTLHTRLSIKPEPAIISCLQFYMFVVPRFGTVFIQGPADQELNLSEMKNKSNRVMFNTDYCFASPRRDPLQLISRMEVAATNSAINYIKTSTPVRAYMLKAASGSRHIITEYGSNVPITTVANTWVLEQGETLGSFTATRQTLIFKHYSNNFVLIDPIYVRRETITDVVDSVPVKKPIKRRISMSEEAESTEATTTVTLPTIEDDGGDSLATGSGTVDV